VSQPQWRRRVKIAMRSVGFDVIRFHPESSDGAKQHAVFKHLATDLVFDVGANEGQYVQLLREFGYAGRVVSFEPLSSAHSKLMVAAQGDSSWRVHERTAIGDRDGDVAINISDNSVSSSVLPMLGKLAEAAPAARYIGSETVPLKRLDSLLGQYQGDAKSIYLKIDTQGFEDAVLRGAEKTLAACRAVQLELTLVPLYEGQQLWQSFIADLTRRGFSVWTILPGFVEESTGRTMQIDAIFVRD
jgi:FkbM family methyltransferase